MRDGSSGVRVWAGVLACLVLAGCPKSGTGPGNDAGPGVDAGGADGGRGDAGQTDGGGNDAGPGPLRLVQVAAVAVPFDAVPDPTGQTVYFTAQDADGGTGVFRVPANGSNLSPVPVSVGAPWSLPLSLAISSDGNTLYVVDPGADNAAGGSGAIFSVSVAAGTPVEVPGTAAFSPRGLALSPDGGGDGLIFTGASSTGAPGVFAVPASGGTPGTVVSGPPLVSPEAIAVLPAGELFLVDMIGDGSGRGAGVKVSNGVAVVVAGGLDPGWPGGAAWSPAAGAVLLSAVLPSDGGVLLATVNPSTGALGSLPPLSGAALVDPGGLRRSFGPDLYAWVDGQGPAGGRVFVLTH